MRHWILLACTAVLLCPAEVQGQKTGDEQAAAEAFARGTKLAEQRNYVEAIEAFQVAYRLRPHFMVQCSIARCQENLNKPVEAAAHYQRCLDEGAKDTGLGKKVRASLDKIRALIVRVEVKSPGKGGTIYVDGRSRGEAPAVVELNPGSHVVEVRRPGAAAASATVKLLGGERRTLSLTPLELRPTAAPTSAPTGTPDDNKRPRRGLSQVWFWSAVGLTAALAVTTTVLGVQTLKLRTEYNDDPTQQRADDFWSRRRLTNILLGCTVAAAAGGTTLFFFTDFGGNRERETGQLTVGVGTGGTF